MSSIRDLLDPGRRMLARRLGELCATLENLGARLSSTIANAIGETIGVIVRDTVLRVLDDVIRYFPTSQSTTGLRDDATSSLTQNHYDDDRGYWDDEEDHSWNAMPETDLDPPPEDRLPAALSAGLQAASWWLRRWTGRKRALTTLAVGLLASGAAFLGGPLIGAVLGLAQTATQFHAISGAAIRNPVIPLDAKAG